MFETLTGRRQHSARSICSAVIAASLALTVSPALAQQAPAEITVVLTEYRFTPDTITLRAGQPVQLNIQNQGKLDHNLSSDDLPLTNINFIKADNSTQDLSRYVSTDVLNADALSGHTSVVTFTPLSTGTFGFFSEDEQSLGMVGKFIVVAAGTQAAQAASSTPSAGASVSPTVARDGQTLSGQSAATQAMFTAVWGNRAAQQWVQEHNAALPH
jgi:plastocyanin